MDRFIAFSDGVVAIAITLLILPLTEIERAEGATIVTVAADDAGALHAFVVSFAVIANYWTIHKEIFRPLRHHVAAVVIWLFSPRPVSGRCSCSSPRKSSLDVCPARPPRLVMCQLDEGVQRIGVHQRVPADGAVRVDPGEDPLHRNLALLAVERVRDRIDGHEPVRHMSRR